MENMEYDTYLGHWIRSAPRTIRRKILWGLIADYAMWFVFGAVIGKYVLPALF